MIIRTDDDDGDDEDGEVDNQNSIHPSESNPPFDDNQNPIHPPMTTNMVRSPMMRIAQQQSHMHTIPFHSCPPHLATQHVHTKFVHFHDSKNQAMALIDLHISRQFTGSQLISLVCKAGPRTQRDVNMCIGSHVRKCPCNTPYTHCHPASTTNNRQTL